MKINLFYEVVLIEMHRQNKNWRYLARLLEKTPTYVRQVAMGASRGPAAERYLKVIADDLGIDLEEVEV